MQIKINETKKKKKKITDRIKKKEMREKKEREYGPVLLLFLSIRASKIKLIVAPRDSGASKIIATAKAESDPIDNL